jgi:hypothetical protein
MERAAGAELLRLGLLQPADDLGDTGVVGLLARPDPLTPVGACFMASPSRRAPGRA